MMDRNIVRTFEPTSANVSIPIRAPEDIPKGIFLHYVSPLGQPLLAEGVIPAGDGVRNLRAQKQVSGAFNQLEARIMHASHMIAREFGGSGEKYNLIPLPKEFNLGQVARYEDQLRQWMQQSDLYLQVFAKYNGTQLIPMDVFYRAFQMKNGKPFGLSNDHSVLVLH